MGPGTIPGGSMPGMGSTNPGRGGKPPAGSKVIVHLMELYTLLTWVCHHVLCFLFQPVHVVEFNCLLMLAASVVGLTHRWLHEGVTKVLFLAHPLSTYRVMGQVSVTVVTEIPTKEEQLKYVYLQLQINTHFGIFPLPADLCPH